MSPLWFTITFCALIIFLWRKDLRSEMIWAGVFALPLLLVKPLVSSNFLSVADSNGGVTLFLAERAIISISLGAFTSAIYQALLHKKITPAKHPKRPHMLWLFLGLIIFALSFFILKQSFILSTVLALATDIIIILILRTDLIWDLIFSGVSLGVLYLIIFMIIYRNFPGNLNDFWFTDSTIGMTIYSVPVEEILAIILFGALWGPLFVAAKDFKTKKLEAR